MKFDIKQSSLEKISEISPNKKNIIKIAEFIKNNFTHIFHAFEYKYYPFEALNIYKLINVYGYGNCKHFSILFKFFMDSIGVKCTMHYGSYGFRKDKKKQKHIFNIIEFKKKKYLIDTDFGIILYKNDLIEYQNSLDKEIFNHVREFGGNVVMTSSSHDRATTRTSEALEHIENPSIRANHLFYVDFQRN